MPEKLQLNNILWREKNGTKQTNPGANKKVYKITMGKR